MSNFVHVVNNWDVSECKPIEAWIEAQEIIPIENLVKVFIYHGGIVERYDSNDNLRKYSSVCICYVYVCPETGRTMHFYEGYNDGRKTFKKFNSLVKCLCGTFSNDAVEPYEHNRFFREITD